MSKITYPIHTADGNEYLILIDSFEKNSLPDFLINALHEIEIFDITLERVAGESQTPASVLFEISNFLAGFLLDNPSAILYFYCDDMHDISRRNTNISPQKFRSDLFSSMFNRYTRQHNVPNITDTTIEIRADRDIYIHLIARTEHLPFVQKIQNSIQEMAAK